MAIIALLVTIIIYGIVFWVLWWALGMVGLPEPFAKVAMVVLVLAAVLVILGVLMGTVPLIGVPGLR